MNILVVGGAGFIGHNVVKFLEDDGHTCLVLDNLTNYGFVPSAELKYLLKARTKKFKARMVQGDILEEGLVNRLVEDFKPDAIIHLASFPRQKIVSQDPVRGSEVMSTGLIVLLEAAKKYNVKRFTYISSSMVYGDFTSEEQDEYSNCEPIGQYGIMKLAGEWLVKDYARRTGMEYVIIRPSAVYGEWDVEDRVVSKFMTMAMRGETLKVKGANEVLDFTYVEDTAMGIVKATLSNKTSGKIYNVTRCEDQPCTLLNAAEIAIEIAGKGQIECMDKDAEFPSRGQLSIKRAQEDFGFTPTVDVREGFRRYFEWYKDNPTLWQK